MGEIITHLFFGFYLDVSRLNETKKVLAIFGFVCYHIFRKGKENPKNQKGKFMKCIHPRRANNLMVNFLSEISDLQFAYVKYGDAVCPVINWESASDEDKANFSFAKRKIQIHKGESFTACFDPFNTQYLKFTYNFEQLESFGAFLFWFNFCKLYPEAENFDPIIPILLHELGHFLSSQNFENYSRMEEIEKLKESDWLESSFDYFNLPDEKSATDWAISWLSKKENQEKAKNFEENFLKCFE